MSRISPPPSTCSINPNVSSRAFVNEHQRSGLPSPGNSLPRPANASRARRRQRGQLIVPRDAEGRAALLSALARRSYPTYELFVYAVLCGAILGLGYVIDSQALLLFGILVAPLLLPWVGMLLATITGSVRFFFETIMALLIGAALVFVIGILAGFASRLFMPRTFNEAYVHSSLWWPDLVVLAIGAVILTVSFVRSEDKPFLPSVMLAYEFFLPISAGRLRAWQRHRSHLAEWPAGLLCPLCVGHHVWAHHPARHALYAHQPAGTDLHRRCVAGLGCAPALVDDRRDMVVSLWAGGSELRPASHLAREPAAGSRLPPSQVGRVLFSLLPRRSSTPRLPRPPRRHAPPTPVPLTLEVTLPATDTPTMTLTFEPTPVYGRVHSSKGVVLRETPGWKSLTTLDDFSIVEVLPDTQDVSNYTWAHVDRHAERHPAQRLDSAALSGNVHPCTQLAALRHTDHNRNIHTLIYRSGALEIHSTVL